MPTSDGLVSFRLDRELLARLDAYSQAKREANPGVRISRSDVIRSLLIECLAQKDLLAGPAAGRNPAPSSGQSA